MHPCLHLVICSLVQISLIFLMTLTSENINTQRLVLSWITTHLIWSAGRERGTDPEISRVLYGSNQCFLHKLMDRSRDLWHFRGLIFTEFGDQFDVVFCTHTLALSFNWRKSTKSHRRVTYYTQLYSNYRLYTNDGLSLWYVTHWFVDSFFEASSLAFWLSRSWIFGARSDNNWMREWSFP